MTQALRCSVLDEHFAKVTLEQHGAVALFSRHYATLIVSTGTSERSAAPIMVLTR